MSLQEEFTKPYNVGASIVLVALLLFLLWPSSEPSEVEKARTLLTFFDNLPSEESHKVCKGIAQIEDKYGDKISELDNLKKRVKANHNCENR